MNIRVRSGWWRIGGWCLGLCLLPGLFTGCSHLSGPRESPAQAAKDWSRVIRAAQVLPVYPLSEDVRPGDVFLVMKPMARQVEVYAEKGFLPLDFLFMRLDVSGLYPKHYPPGYWTTEFGQPPHDRTTTRLEAPRVAFPGYSFASRQDGRLDLPIPVQGVTVGMTLLGAYTVSGTIQLGEAYTYGVGNLELYNLLRSSIEEEGLGEFLLRTRRMLKRDFYLRVVSRVFVIKSIDVLVQRQSVFGGSAHMAATPGAKAAITAADFDQTMPEERTGTIRKGNNPSCLDEMASGQGGRRDGIPSCTGEVAAGLCLVERTCQAVTLRERFDRPLVVGYLGFDVLVDSFGRFSSLIPSFAVMEETVTESEMTAAIPFVRDPTNLSQSYREWLVREGNYQKMANWLEARGVKADPADLYNSPLSRKWLPEADKAFGFSQSKTCTQQRREAP